MDKSNLPPTHHLITSLRSDESSSGFEDLNPPHPKEAEPKSQSIEQSIELDMPLKKLHDLSKSLQVSEELNDYPRKTSKSAILESQIDEQPQQEQKAETKSVCEPGPPIQNKSAIVEPSPSDVNVKRPYSQLAPAEQQKLDESLSSSKTREPQNKHSNTMGKAIASAIIAGFTAIGVFLFTKKKRYAAVAATVVFAATYDTLKKSE